MTIVMPDEAPARDGSDGPPTERDLLDAYSSVVTGVARALAPAVAGIRADRPRSGVSGSGSAVVVSPDGLLLTSAHVVGQSEGGTATFADGSDASFDVVGADPLSDLAVLRLRLGAGAAVPEPATLGDAQELVVGQLVVAVGNPLGFAGSVSAGVVSGLGRSLATRSGSATRVVDDVIQTDAALHPGNSGGALADSRARVVGINTAVVGPGVGQGLGLAVPVNAATLRIIGVLIHDGRVRRAYLGVGGAVRPLPPAGRGSGMRRGVEVTMVVATGPAGRAGVRIGDVLVAVDGNPVEGVAQLQALMTETKIGEPTVLTLWRGERFEDLVVVPVELEG
jgi:S1-C subfamily serine protease